MFENTERKYYKIIKYMDDQKEYFIYKNVINF